ncbi:fimbrial protein [Pantoea sp. SGAir0184]
MKLKHVAVALITLLVASAQAADGTLNFTGTVTDKTCNITTTGDVTMANLSHVQFPGKGSVSQPAEFKITLAACAAGVNTVSVRFDGTPADGDNSIIALTTSGETATGVGVQIREKDGTPIPLLSDSKPVTVTSNAAEATFDAVYISTADSVGPGNANATATFNVFYN